MTDQYSGECIVRLMRTTDKNREIPRPEVEIGGQIIEVDGLKYHVGPEIIEGFKHIEAEKRQAIATGKPYTKGQWQTQDPQEQAIFRALAKAVGFPDIFD